eukprot:6087611-Amphidinium_carterae.1
MQQATEVIEKYEQNLQKMKHTQSIAPRVHHKKLKQKQATEKKKMKYHEHETKYSNHQRTATTSTTGRT